MLFAKQLAHQLSHGDWGGFNIKEIADQPDFIAAFFHIAEQSKSQSFPWDAEPHRSNLLTLSRTSFSETKTEKACHNFLKVCSELKNTLLESQSPQSEPDLVEG